MPVTTDTDIRVKYGPMILPSICAASLGVKYDFAYGCRVLIPSSIPNYRVTMRDADTGQLMFSYHHRGAFTGDGNVGTLFTSSQKYFVRWHLQVHADDYPVVDHVYDAEDQPVYVIFPGALGDTVSRLNAVRDFQQKHRCKLTVALRRDFLPFVDGHEHYKEITFAPYDTPNDAVAPRQFYAAYAMGVFFDQERDTFHKRNIREIDEISCGADVLGVDPCYTPPHIRRDYTLKRAPLPYACIAMDNPTTVKQWLYPGGWQEVVDWLASCGLGVVAVDSAREGGTAVRPELPRGAVSAGKMSLLQRVTVLKRAQLMIGMHSGMSWLAWTQKTPTVVIGGFTEPWAIFKGATVVRNPDGCHGCWQDKSFRFTTSSENWCPRLKNTPRMYECSKTITPAMVIAACLKYVSPRKLKI